MNFLNHKITHTKGSKVTQITRVTSILIEKSVREIPNGKCTISVPIAKFDYTQDYLSREDLICGESNLFAVGDEIKVELGFKDGTYFEEEFSGIITNVTFRKEVLKIYCEDKLSKLRNHIPSIFSIPSKDKKSITLLELFRKLLEPKFSVQDNNDLNGIVYSKYTHLGYVSALELVKKLCSNLGIIVRAGNGNAIYFDFAYRKISSSKRKRFDHSLNIFSENIKRDRETNEVSVFAVKGSRGKLLAAYSIDGLGKIDELNPPTEEEVSKYPNVTYFQAPSLTKESARKLAKHSVRALSSKINDNGTITADIRPKIDMFDNIAEIKDEKCIEQYAIDGYTVKFNSTVGLERTVKLGLKIPIT